MSGPTPLQIGKKADFYFRPFYTPTEVDGQVILDPHLPRRIVVIGCGGNGGYLIPWIARYISQSNSRIIRDIGITLIDGDRVEEKNIVRQNFTADEIGEYKSVALADRCNRNLGTNVAAIAEYFTPALRNELGNGPVAVFGCVDRHEVRKALCDWLKISPRGNVYVDVGNELSAGQLFISSWVKRPATKAEAVSQQTYRGRGQDMDHFFLTMDAIYKEVDSADPTKARPSCDEAAAGGLQRMGINLTASILAFRAFEALLSPDPIPYYEVAFNNDQFKTYWLSDLKMKSMGVAERKG